MKERIKELLKTKHYFTLTNGHNFLACYPYHPCGNYWQAGQEKPFDTEHQAKQYLSYVARMHLLCEDEKLNWEDV